MRKTWAQHFEDQQEICKKCHAEWVPTDLELKIGIADLAFTELMPINGLRHCAENGTTGWYIWSGEHLSENTDFFKPYCMKHLIELKPEIIKYLGLPAGFRFLIDNQEFEDIWEDKSLLEIEPSEEHKAQLHNKD